jgi:Flp pilus assembly protein TadG
VRHRRANGSDEGSALIEMALITPVLLLLVLGAGDFARVMYTSIVLANAARAGAAYGMQSVGDAADEAGIEQAARDEAQNIDPIGVDVEMECECQDLPGTLVSCVATTCPDDYGEPRVFTQVTTTITFQTIVAYPVIPNTVELSRTARVRVQ